MVKRPLRPYCITPQEPECHDLLASGKINPEFYPIVCCTASRQTHGSEVSDSGYSYIQGAGDDNEIWSHGLTPAIFWRHRKLLLEASEDLLPGLIQKLMATEKASQDNDISTGISTVSLPQGTIIHLGTLAAARQATRFDGIIACVDDPATPSEQHTREEEEKTQSNIHNNSKRLNLACGFGKLGSRALRNELCRIEPFVASLVSGSDDNNVPQILFACPTGRDLAVGVALVFICLFLDNDDSESNFGTIVITLLYISSPPSPPSFSQLPSFSFTFLNTSPKWGQHR